MKKLLLLLLVFTGMVTKANAWGDMYLLCNENNSWGYNNSDAFKFTCTSENHYRATVPGSYITSGSWYFRFREKDSNTWYNICPNDNSADAEITSTAVSTGTGNPGSNAAKAFYISKNASAKYVQIFCTWNTSTSKWDITCSIITSASSYTIAFTNPDSWDEDKVSVHAFVDGIALNENGDWPGRTMTYDSTNGLYTATITNVIDNSKIKFSNDGSNETGAINLVNDAVYNKSDKIAKQSVSISAFGNATFCSQYPLDFSSADGITAYRIYDSDKATGVLSKESVTKIPAGVGVYVEGTASQSYDISPTATATSIGTNMLVGVTSETKIYQIDGSNTNYILTVNKVDGTADTPKFFKVYDDGDATLNEAEDDGNTVPAGKAYLQIPTVSAAREFFWFEDDMTGIEKVSVDTKALNGAVYNLAGQRVAQPTKGLYIVNGKKVVLK